jgi:hypothetical protein
VADDLDAGAVSTTSTSSSLTITAALQPTASAPVPTAWNTPGATCRKSKALPL